MRTRCGQVRGLALSSVALLFTLPLVWLLTAAFDARAGLRVELPREPTLDNFAAVLTSRTTLRPLFNSVVLCGFGTALTLLCASMAAYPLSRRRFRMRRPFLLALLFAAGLPVTALLVPVYGLFARLRLTDTMSGTVLFLAATSLPSAVWLVTTYIDAVPRTLDEAAAVDGATPSQVLWQVVLPAARPGISVVALLTFTSMWGNFFVPFTLLQSPAKQPLPVSVFEFFYQNGQAGYGRLAAFSLLYTVPVFVLHLALGRRVEGAHAVVGAVKG